MNAENEQQRNGIGHGVSQTARKQMLRKWQIFPLIKPECINNQIDYTAHCTHTHTNQKYNVAVQAQARPDKQSRTEHTTTTTIEKTRKFE